MLIQAVDGTMRQLRRLVAARCRLCRGAIDHGEVCDACAFSLPWIAHACHGCAMPLADASLALCVGCVRAGAPFDRAWAAFRLAAPIQRLVHQVKYEADFGAAHALGVLVARKLGERREPLPDLLIPVPLHQGRLRARGYNQARQIAQAVCTVLSIPLAPQGRAVRVRATSDQIGQTATQRRGNLDGAFEVTEALHGTVALIDDVMTTGATLSALARACRKAGASRIEAWAVARAI